jgi:AcrR family transcriptional regulator
MEAGLRERKKERTRQAIADTAISLFLARGFDEVSTADIAAAVEVSKPTLFRYFATKEDLVVHRFADHIGESARVVRDRRDGETPLAALHQHFQKGLDRRDPITGLCDDPGVLAFHRLVYETQSLRARLSKVDEENAAALAEALAEATDDRGGVRPRALAAQVGAVWWVLARANWTRLAEGRSAAEVHPEAMAAAAEAFALLTHGAAPHGY